MRGTLVFLLLYLPLCVMGQKIRIVDSLIVKKSNQNAIALNVRLSFPETTQMPLVLSKTHVFVVSDPVIAHSLSQDEKKFNAGLIYVVENTDGLIIPLSGYPGYPGFSPLLPNLSFTEDVDIGCSEKRCVFSKEEMKLQFKDVSCDSLEYYDNQSLLLFKNDTTIVLYPIISDNDLEPGHYKFYLFYYNNVDNLYNNITKSCYVFRGELISNKVDLIVENYPVKWWMFWKRKKRY